MSDKLNKETLDKLSVESKRELLMSLIEKKSPQVNSFSLSYAQRRLWFLYQLDPNNPVYNIFFAIHLKGILNYDLLEKSFNEIATRHETLRTNFCTVDGEPRQMIRKDANLKLDIESLRTYPLSKRFDYALNIAEKESEKPFDIENDYLIRFKLLEIDDSENILLLSMHHIISDGWSMGLFFKELSHLYSSFINGKNPSLPELPIQYIDFAEWQKGQLEGEQMQKHIAYWKEKLKDAPVVLDLFSEKVRSTVQSSNGKIKYFNIDSEEINRIKSLCNENGASLFMALLSVFGILVYKYTSSKDFIVGAPVSNRVHENIEPLIGFFVNTLPLRIHVNPEDNFNGLLSKIRETVLEAYEHQELPFEILVQELQLERNVSHSPLIQVVFTFLNNQFRQLVLPGIEVEKITLNKNFVRVDLEFHINHTDRGLSGSIQYNTDLFDEEKIERMIGHFKLLLHNVTTEKESPISQLSLLSQEEYNKLIHEFNETQTNFPRKCIHELFEEQAKSHSGKPAIVYDKKILTYLELNKRANQLASFLRNNGIKPGNIVGILLEDPVEIIICILGILKSGGAYLPIDNGNPNERIKYILQDSSAKLLIANEHDIYERNLDIGHVEILDINDNKINEQNILNLNNVSNPKDVAYIIYTSGTTGLPKGVIIEHKGISNTIQWRKDEYKLNEFDKTIQLFRYFFDGYLTSIFTPLVCGSTIYFVPSDKLFDPLAINRLIKEQSITHFITVPALFSVILETLVSKDAASLKCVTLAGDNVNKELILESKIKLPNLELINEYGPTENSVASTIFRHMESSDKIKIGKPIANTKIYILSENNTLQPIAIPGEICLGGIGLARGYLNQDKLNAEKFIANPYDIGEIIYKTGDIGRWSSDGNIELLGRIDEQIKLRGHRIETSEIETVLLAHKEINNAKVLLYENIKFEKSLCAYFTADKTLLSSEIKNFLSSKLPAYMIPTYYVQLDEMPLNRNGKIDIKGLPVPKIVINNEQKYTTPESYLERNLIKIWQELLNIDDIRVNDNFFDLGGHSLLLYKIVDKLDNELKKKISIIDLFKYPTISSLCNFLNQTLTDEKPINKDKIEQRKNYILQKNKRTQIE